MRRLHFNVLTTLARPMCLLARMHEAECAAGRYGNAIFVRLAHAPFRGGYILLYRAFVALYAV